MKKGKVKNLLPFFQYKIMKTIRVFLRSKAFFGAAVFLSNSLSRLHKLRGALLLTYDPEVCQDGTGAQWMRVISILAVAKRHRCQYVFTPLSDVTVTPMDSFQSMKEVSEYLEELNVILSAETIIHTKLSSNGTINESKPDVYRIQNLTYFSLLRYRIKSIIFNKTILLSCGNAFGVSELSPLIYKNMNFEIWKSKIRSYVEKITYSNMKEQFSGRFDVAVHYRKGSNGSDKLIHESHPRILPKEYFINAIQQISREFGQNLDPNLKVCILTDSPEKDFEYTPINSQLDRWKDEPRLHQGKVEIIGEQFDWLIEAFPDCTFQLIRGGNPLVSLDVMINSRSLVISRSAFSFIAGLIGGPEFVVCPKGFVHNPPRSWQVM
jgi:hypothetical protein